MADRLRTMPSCFDEDTAVERLGAGRFAARLSRRWWIVSGPNGGYLAAIVLRAMVHVLGDAQRLPRSLTVHFLERAKAGPAEIHTRIERTGRQLTTVSARLHQGDRLTALALGAFSKPRPSWEFHDASMPVVSRLEDAPVFRTEAGHAIPMHERYDMRWAVDERLWSGAARARSGAWVRLKEPHVVDPPLAAALADALPPAIFTRSTRGDGPMAIPTIDLTIHFRVPLPIPGTQPDDFALAIFQTRVVRDGFLEEDGEIWSRDGTLLAQSRQLALLF